MMKPPAPDESTTPVRGTDSRPWLAPTAALLLIVIMEVVMLLAVRQESQTSDEGESLWAGYLQLALRDFAIRPGYPPLAHDLATLPLLAFHPQVPHMTPAEVFDYRGGRIFLDSNPAAKMLFAARAAMTLFPLLLAVFVFLTTKEMFGSGTALTALALVAFEPNLLAHGPLVTNDVALACCLFAAVSLFWFFMTNPSAWRLVACGVAGGMTLAAKHSGVILFPILLVLAVLEMAARAQRGMARDPSPGSLLSPLSPGERVKERIAREWSRLVFAVVAVGLISFATLWAFYGFRYSAEPQGVGVAPPLAAYLDGMHSRGAATVLRAAGRIHALPEAYLEGLAFLNATDTRPTYLLGRLYPRGVWFYFPVAFAIKSTLGFLLLLAITALFRPRGKQRELLWMLIPAAGIFATSMASPLNIGIRHILPMFPFLVVVAAVGAWNLARRGRVWQVIVAVLVLNHAGSSLRAFPNYLAYANEVWGGPSRTYRVLTDSNVDWGQGLPAVKRYVESHAGTPCWLVYFGTVDPARYAAPCMLLPASSSVIWGRKLDPIPPVIEGTVLVSATEMSGQAWGPAELNPYEPFRTARPVDCVAGSILVFQGRFSVPLASALSRLPRVVALGNQGNFDGAMAEAHEAEPLAPNSVDVQFVIGQLLKAAGRTAEARQTFAQALHLAQTIYPTWQAYWIPILTNELKTGDSPR